MPSVETAQGVVPLKNWRIFGDDALSKLDEFLSDGETVRRVTRGTYYALPWGNTSGILVLTDRRLFYLKSGWKCRVLMDLPVETISSVQWKCDPLVWLGSVGGTARITVRGSGRKVRIGVWADGREIVDLIQSYLGHSQRSL